MVGMLPALLLLHPVAMVLFTRTKPALLHLSSPQTSSRPRSPSAYGTYASKDLAQLTHPSRKLEQIPSHVSSSGGATRSHKET